MDRRLILPLAALPLAAQGSEAGETPHTATEQTAPPNIVLFLVDDMGWQDTSVPFHECRTPLNDRYRTPNMERLAEMGVRFTAAYACAISSPSRCSLLSGMNAARHRVTNWTLDYGRATDAASDVLELPDWHWNGIQPDTAASPHNTRNATPVTTLPRSIAARRISEPRPPPGPTPGRWDSRSTSPAAPTALRAATWPARTSERVRRRRSSDWKSITVRTSS